MPDLAIYEHPLNERVRTLLRLEHLFQQTAYHLPQSGIWSSRAAIDGLLDIINILARADIKSELIKELERHAITLGKIRSTPDIDMQRLGNIMDELEAGIDELHRINGQIGRRLRENDFLNTVMQRSSIPGGNCAFDLPQYYHWLQQPHGKRLADLRQWMGELEPLQSATRLLLSLIRGSIDARWEQAEDGGFQYTLESQAPTQLIRVGLPSDSNLFPVISGGKHRFSIRFMESCDNDRPRQIQQNVAFSLTCCTL